MYISGGGILLPEGSIHPVVNVLALAWFIRYSYVWNLQFPGYVIYQNKCISSSGIGNQGRIQDFKLGGGGAHLNNCAEWKEARYFFGVFRVKNHDFTPKKSYFFQF